MALMPAARPAAETAVRRCVCPRGRRDYTSLPWSHMWPTARRSRVHRRAPLQTAGRFLYSAVTGHVRQAHLCRQPPPRGMRLW